MPAAIKGPAKAYSMSENGYVDKAGNQLPMSVEAHDILAQAMGFNTAEKAEYQEQKLAGDVREGVLRTQARNIRKNLAVSIERGDVEGQKEWVSRARQFDADNPAYAVIPGMAATLRRRAKDRAFARAYHVPLGTRPKDIGGQEISRYGNY